MAESAEVTLYMIGETERAYHFSTHDKDEHAKARAMWIPKSVIVYMRKHPVQKDHWRMCHLRIPAWKAKQLNLEDESD